jgi:fatty-acyl-CoA synthase
MTGTALKRHGAVASELVRTPRANRRLALRLADFQTLTEGLDYAAEGVTGFNFYGSRGSLEHVLPFAALRRQALVTARRLLSLGLRRGDRVAAVAETGPEFMVAFFACQYAGLIPCPVPYSMHIGGKDAYVERVAGMLAAADVSAAVATAELKDDLRAAADRAGVGTVMTYGELQALPEAASKLEPFGPGDDAYIQYSSGSTSDPKGVLIGQKAVVANTHGILHCIGATARDRGFSWLPLYHDMGLVGFCLAPMMGQLSIDYLSTAAFARRPALWLRLMSENRCTTSYAPTFGYELAARRINGEARTLDLSHWRVAGIGGDMVRADVLESFAHALAVAGFDRRAFRPSYGMAETTLAIAFTDVGRSIRVDTVDRQALKTEGRAVPGQASSATRSFVVCGKPIPGCTVEIRGSDGRALGQREVGRIFVTGPSLMAGYFRDPEATRAAIDEAGFLDTGDMGYWLDGEIVLTGRAKDLILHNGRNIWPQDIEWAAERVEPLRGGDVAAFAVEDAGGGDEVVVLVECRLQDAAESERLRREVSAVVHRGAGVECRVVMVPPKSLPFTSSGKLSRALARQRYLAGDIAEIARTPFAVAAE